jgi:hypothetical protein
LEKEDLRQDTEDIKEELAKLRDDLIDAREKDKPMIEK